MLVEVEGWLSEVSWVSILGFNLGRQEVLFRSRRQGSGHLYWDWEVRCWIAFLERSFGGIFYNMNLMNARLTFGVIFPQCHS